jgi:glutathione S-transferase
MINSEPIRHASIEAAKAGSQCEQELTLFHAAHSTCSQKVRLCLAEKGLAYNDHLMTLDSREHLSPSYLALNPNGVVPTLLHSGVSIIDSSAICEYIDEVWPRPALSSASAASRAQMRAWMRYLEEVPTVAIRIPSIDKMFLDHIQSLGTEWEQVKSKSPLRRGLYDEIGERGFSESKRLEADRMLRSCLDRAEAALGRSQWLIGEQISIADLVLAPTIVRMEDLGLAGYWADKPHVTRWYASLRKRPSFARAFFPGTRQTAPQQGEIV